MSAIERIAQTREALASALAERDWVAITQLDLACRECIEAVVAERASSEPELGASLEELLGVYRQLIDAATGERQAIADEMTQIQRAKEATKVYHLFG